MRHFNFLLGVLTCFVFCVPAWVHAEERILSFDTHMTVATDASVQIIETLVYDFGAADRHGILRDVPKVFTDTIGTKHSLDLAVVSITDEKGVAYSWKDESDFSTYHFRIGDAARTISGAHTYVITYRASDVLSFLNDRDELYWNVTGNGWVVPIDAVSASVVLPKGITKEDLHTYCYRGGLGDTMTCHSIEVLPQETYTQKTSQPVSFGDGGLSPAQGLTIAVGFPKGFVTEHRTLTQRVRAWILQNLKEIDVAVAFLIPLCVGLFLYREWYKNGKDPKGSGVIVPEYEPPVDLSVLEAALVLRTSIKPSDISAAIIALAVKGALRIEEVTETTLLIFKKKSYSLIQLNTANNLLPAEVRLLAVLFSVSSGAKGNVLLLSEVAPAGMYSSLLAVQKVAGNELVAKKYFTRNPLNVVWTLFLPVSVCIVGLFLTAYIGMALSFAWIGMGCAAALTFLFLGLMPQKTKEGALVREKLLGLKRYIEVAEKDRIEFHNAPEKTPELFEKLLPYAILFDLTDIWTKEFADIMKKPPQWYSGSGNAFVLGSFVSDLNSFSSTFTSASTPPSSSGSGGGGFSGGGGGGGGGGSW